MRQMILGVLLICGALAAHASDDDPTRSLYHLDAKLTNQAGQRHGFDVYRGHPVLVTMFYGSCQATCPLIIDTLRATERALPAAQRAGLRVLMISIDPQRDTPAALHAIAGERHIDGARWTLAHADASTVRTIAALLNVQYRQLPGGEFNHSTVITLLSPRGEIEATTSTLGHADPALIAQLRE
jgi:protein SCO1/2